MHLFDQATEHGIESLGGVKGGSVVNLFCVVVHLTTAVPAIHLV
ncbi:MAG TPA: hypothetical protein VMM84_00075 [Pyrinomonadaceae bacterium]|nr:hypothetical protein [Pyrinomonadaceae bacterium]